MAANKRKILVFVNVLMFLDFILVVLSGLQRWRFHILTAYILIILVLAHLILNWNWVRFFFKRSD